MKALNGPAPTGADGRELLNVGEEWPNNGSFQATGAAISGINTLWRESGTYGGKAQYTAFGVYTCRWETDRWRMRNAALTETYYYLEEDEPATTANWMVDTDGSGPPPNTTWQLEGSTADGEVGEIKRTTSHIYVCVSANSWRRASLSTF